MTEGEMLQTRYLGRLDLTQREYFELIERKTAALFACSCELAGLVAELRDADRDALRRYGLYLGMEFQVVDDILDVTGREDRVGKPVASDLRRGEESRFRFWICCRSRHGGRSSPGGADRQRGPLPSLETEGLNRAR